MDIKNDNINNIQRKTKQNKYILERKQIIDKIFDILEINNNNKYFNINELDENINKQNEILNLKDEIHTYFLTGNWKCFKKGIEIDRPYLSIIKHIFRHENINFILSRKMIKGKTFILFNVII
jgi:hypothetical protein